MARPHDIAAGWDTDDSDDANLERAKQLSLESLHLQQAIDATIDVAEFSFFLQADDATKAECVRALESESGCALNVTRYGVHVVGQSPEGMETVKRKITESRLARSENAAATLDEYKARRVAMYLDVSNLLAWPKRQRMDLKVAALIQVIAGVREVCERYACGSRGLGAPVPRWVQEFEAEGIKTACTERASGGEEAVDEKLHAPLYKAILEELKKPEGERTTIVIVTGDGNDNHGAPTSFLNVAQQAIDARVPVEVWSWARQCSAAYKKLYTKGDITLRYIDSFKDRLLAQRQQPQRRHATGTTPPPAARAGGLPPTATPSDSDNARRGVCREGPNCKWGARCKFLHPERVDAGHEVCREGPNCRYGARCKFLHPERVAARRGRARSRSQYRSSSSRAKRPRL